MEVSAQYGGKGEAESGRQGEEQQDEGEMMYSGATSRHLYDTRPPQGSLALPAGARPQTTSHTRSAADLGQGQGHIPIGWPDDTQLVGSTWDPESDGEDKTLLIRQETAFKSAYTPEGLTGRGSGNGHSYPRRNAHKPTSLWRRARRTAGRRRGGGRQARRQGEEQQQDEGEVVSSGATSRHTRRPFVPH